MPSKSKAQQHLFAAAAHGANFGMAKKIRSSMTLQQMAEFEDTPTKNLPGHVKTPKAKSPSRRTRQASYESSYSKIPATLNTASSFPQRKGR